MLTDDTPTCTQNAPALVGPVSAALRPTRAPGPKTPARLLSASPGVDPAFPTGRGPATSDDEPVHVQYGQLGPAQFLWRNHLWVVRDVLSRHVRARRTSAAGESPTTMVVWEVAAANGAADGGGRFKLVKPADGGSWRLTSRGEDDTRMVHQ